MATMIEDRIRARAQELWEEEGRPQGKVEEHWRRAAEELRVHFDETDASTLAALNGVATSGTEAGNANKAWPLQRAAGISKAK